MEIDNKLALLEDYRNIRENVAFHFTSQSNIKSIKNKSLLADGFLKSESNKGKF
jgi:hypothetical protein